MFENKNPYGATVSEFDVSPDNRYIYFKVDFYEASGYYLFDLNNGNNINENHIMVVQSIDWGSDDDFAYINSSYSEYTGDGVEGTYRLNKKTGKLDLI